MHKLFPIKYFLGVLFLFILLSPPVLSQGVCPVSDSRCDSLQIPIYFRFDDAMILRDYRSNNESFQLLDSVFSSSGVDRIDSIVIVGSSSPDGLFTYNRSLAARRARAMSTYMHWRYPTSCVLPVDVRINNDMIGTLSNYVREDCNVPRQAKVLELLIDNTRSTDTRMANLRLLSGGSYRYLSRAVFPLMRTVVSYMIYYQPLRTMADLPDVPDTPDTLKAVDTIKVAATTPVETTPFLPVEEVTSDSYLLRPLLAVKTNLLFDIASALNIELEVPLGQRWSVAAEWIFPWWLWKSKQRCFELLNGNLEGRYWWGNRRKKEILTGWFSGLYAGGGLYDLEWEDKGYQGEFFIAAGLSGGYAHRIGKNLRMEYSLGIGYMQTKYREYVPQQDGEILMWQKDGKFSWFGPTRAKVSLVWLLNYKSKKGGAK